MADSPGALVPGSTPAAASNTVLKGLFTLQGLALVGAGAWLLMKRRKGKATRRNPLRNPRRMVYRQSGIDTPVLAIRPYPKRSVAPAYMRTKKWCKAHRLVLIEGIGGKSWINAALKDLIRKNPTASWGRSMRKRRGAWLKKRFNKNPWSELDSGLPRGGAFPQDKAFKEMVSARVKDDLRRERIGRIRDRQRRRGSKYGNLWANPGPYLKIAGTKYDNDEAGWRQLAKDAPSFSRQELIRILVWNDRNGTYTDEDCKAERMDPMTKDEAVEHIRRVADDNYES